MYYYNDYNDRIMTWKPPKKYEGYKTVPCKKQRCTTCNFINSDNYIHSVTTNKSYMTHLGARQGTCNTKGIVYGISCTKCDGCIYVGITARDLKTRFMEHRNNVIKRKLTHLPLYTHFTENEHTYEHMRIQIIHKSDKESKEDISEDLRQNETLWIKILNTAYPFGCNDNISGYGNTTEEINFERKTDHPFFRYPCQRKPRSHGKNSRAKRKSHIPMTTVNEAYTKLTNNAIEIKDIIRYLRSLPKQLCQELLTKAMDNRHNITYHRLLAIYYVIASLHPKKNKKDKPDKQIYRWTVGFPNKGMEFVKLETILKDRHLQKSLPYVPTKQISITFTYNKPSKLTFCNYNKILKNLDQETLNHIVNKPCDCHSNPFLYQPLNHVLTGNLNIIKNTTLRDIFSKGSKYRPVTEINWDDNDRDIKNALDNLIKWFGKDSKLSVDRFTDFKNRFTYLYHTRKEAYKRNLQSNTTEEDRISKADLKEIHDKYVITVVDKAPNNLVIMCKKLFVITLCKELGVNYNNWTTKGNDVYIPILTAHSDIIQGHVITSSKYGLRPDQSKLEMATIYPIPKLHKTPHKFRFIASSKASSIKPLSILLDNILGHIKNHFRNICKKIFKRTGINPWWSIDSTYDYIDICNKIQNNGIRNKHIFSGDFSDMFTSCKHQTMLANLCSVVDICFKNSGCTFLRVENRKTTYTNEANKERSFRKEEIYELIEYILKNNYVTFAGLTFKQVKGVPMGLSSAPKMIDLTMAYCEYRFMTDRNKTEVARSIGNYTCRYVDDFCSFTNSPIQELVKDIYPTELTLNTTSLPNTTNFLDTTVLLANNTLTLSVYNKTDDFPFPVIKYNHPRSNVHSSTGYNTLYGEMMRFARISNTKEHFLNRSRMLYVDFKKLGYEKHRILITIFKFIHQNQMLMFKHRIMDEKDGIAFVHRLET